MEDLKSKIIDLGGKEWIKNDMHRIYINNSILNVLLGELSKGPVNFGETNNKIFFDVKANAVLRSYKGKKPKIEIEY